MARSASVAAGGISSASQLSPASNGSCSGTGSGDAVPNASHSAIAFSQWRILSRTRATPCSQSSTGNSRPMVSHEVLREPAALEVRARGGHVAGARAVAA